MEKLTVLDYERSNKSIDVTMMHIFYVCLLPLFKAVKRFRFLTLGLIKCQKNVFDWLKSLKILFKFFLRLFLL